jgi:DNA-binding transcriptional regulator YiaG
MSIKDQIKDYLGEYINDFDVDAIVSDIRDRDIEDIDEIDESDFQDIIQAHDTSGKPSSLAEMRRDAGLTQLQLAEMVGVSQGRLSEWETGVREMSATSCYKVAKALGVGPGKVVESVVTYAR